MTEAEWLAATNPRPMLAYLDAQGLLTDRKQRLHDCACVRRIWHLLIDERGRRAVETAERFADRTATLEELREAQAEALAAADARAIPYFYLGAGNPNSYAALSAAAGAAWEFRSGTDPLSRAVAAFSQQGLIDKGLTGQQITKAKHAELAVQTALAREIFGSPFRPAPAIARAWLTWNCATIRKLAESAYAERTPAEGTLEAARLTVLADALEDAGCTDANLLGHLRGPGPHVRGCWALDLVLGKE
jgi:hypothetical protein